MPLPKRKRKKRSDFNNAIDWALYKAKVDKDSFSKPSDFFIARRGVVKDLMDTPTSYDKRLIKRAGGGKAALSGKEARSRRGLELTVVFSNDSRSNKRRVTLNHRAFDHIR